MRKFLMTGAVVLSMASISSIAMAQENTVGGAAVGAGTGLIVGGPPGAVVGGIIGGTVGAAADHHRAYHDERVYVEPRCFRDEFGRRFCR